MKVLLGLGFLLVLAACTTRASSRPPATRVVAVTETLHGVGVVDNYRWLEGDRRSAADRARSRPEVVAWTDAQNAYTRSRARRAARSSSARRPSPAAHGSRLGHGARGARHPLFLLEARGQSRTSRSSTGATATKVQDRVLIDPGEDRPVGPDDGRVDVAVGRRQADRVRHVPLRRREHDAAPARRGLRREAAARDSRQDAGARLAAGRIGLRLSESEEPEGSVQRPGAVPPASAPNRSPGRAAVPAIHEGRRTRRSRRRGARSRSLSRDGRWLVLGYWIDTRSNDLWLVNFDEFRKTGRIDRKVVTVGESGQAFGTVIDGTLYLQTTKGRAEGARGRGAGSGSRASDAGATSCPSGRTPSSRA